MSAALIVAVVVLAGCLGFAGIHCSFHRHMHNLYRDAYKDSCERYEELRQLNKDSNVLFDQAMTGWRHSMARERELLHESAAGAGSLP